ncbi:MAG: class I SAM-dependent methyltransferase [Opitutaceae bacterium]|nr:class I SAM-dependent methyltransferase [Opitutaceae bacterium]
MSFKQIIHSTAWARRREPLPWLIGLTTFGILALELALIRWTSSQVRVFAYFNNVVLICAFLGMGLGVALGRRRPGLVHLALPVLLLLSLALAFSQPLGLMRMGFPDQSIMLWGAQIVPGNVYRFAGNMAIFAGLLGLIVAVFVCCGAPLGYFFGRLETLRAYHADLAGSLLGVLAFTLAAYFDAGPPVWLALGCIPLVWLARHWSAVILAAAVIWLAHLSVQSAIYSPYNRIDLLRLTTGEIELRVNRDFHQYMYNLSDARLAQSAGPAEQESSLQGLRDLYDLPFVLNARRDRAVVVGAGTGNDVQAALRHGYRHVTSVDIDGRIIALGRQLHPEAPYANPAVEPVVDDARAFFSKHRGEAYDVVCFGLLDSHAMSSAMSTLRLDNYVYTEEGIRAAWGHVGPGGHLSLAISCMAGDWFFERLYWTVARATGREPIAFYSRLHSGTVTYVVPRPEARLDEAMIAARMKLTPARTNEQTQTTSDDWPFLYLRPGVIPWGYLAVIGLILTFALVSVRRVFGFGREGVAFHWPLFLMGAAFLLIETRGVTSLSLLFGSTWVVNSVVFAGILVMVIAANAAVVRWQWQDPRPWFGALVLAVLLLYFFPVGWLHTLSLPVRGLIGGLLTGLPIGIAGVIVPMLLKREPDPAAALGANLLGAVLGGCLEYFSMLGGLRATALLALVLYLLAYLALTAKRNRAPAAG